MLEKQLIKARWFHISELRHVGCSIWVLLYRKYVFIRQIPIPPLISWRQNRPSKCRKFVELFPSPEAILWTGNRVHGGRKSTKREYKCDHVHFYMYIDMKWSILPMFPTKLKIASKLIYNLWKCFHILLTLMKKLTFCSLKLYFCDLNGEEMVTASFVSLRSWLSETSI